MANRAKTNAFKFEDFMETTFKLALISMFLVSKSAFAMDVSQAKLDAFKTSI